MSWATPAEAQTITTETITQDELDSAHQIIMIYVGVTDEAIDNLKPRDLALLKAAESFQAAWMKRQVDLLGRSDADQVYQDDLRAVKGDRDMHVLAPYAKACLRRLSWKKTKTIDPLTPAQALLLRNKRHAETYATYSDAGEEPFDEDDMTSGWRRL